ncbi:hypothetical protein [Spirosoma aerophilum]
MVTEQVAPEVVHDAVPVIPATDTPIKFDVSQSAITQMKKEAAKLSIKGPDDKVGFNAVYKFRQMVKDQRIDVENKQKALKRPHIDYNRDVDSHAKALIEPMKAIENALAFQEKAYNDERDRLAEERERAIRVRTDQRTQMLRSSGFTYNAINDAWEFGEVAINFDDIKGLNEEDCQPTADLVKSTYEAEQQRIADERFRGERADVRMKALRALGFIWDAEQEWYTFTDGEGTGRYEVCPRDLMNLTDEEYEPIASTAQRIYDAEQARIKAIADEQAAIALANQQEAARLQAIADQQAADQLAIENARKQLEEDKKTMILDNRRPKLVEAGFDWNGFRSKLLNVFRLSEADIIDMTEVEFADLLTDAQAKTKEAAEEADRVAKAQKRDEAAKKAADRARVARLKPDKKVIKTHLLSAFEKPAPAVSEPESTSFLKRLYDEWDEFVKQQMELLDAL